MYILNRQICSSDNTDEVKNRLKPYFTSLANGYIEICEKQEQKEKAFFGLRDFYRYKISGPLMHGCNDPVLYVYMMAFLAYSNNDYNDTRMLFYPLIFSLIKMLYWMCKNTDCEPTEKQLEHAIKRNFGGLADLNTFEIFQNHLKTIKRSSSPNTVKEVVRCIISTN